MSTREWKGNLVIVRSVVRLAAAAGLTLCSSCSSPPAPDDGLVGLLYQTATRHESSTLIGRQTAVIDPQDRVQPVDVRQDDATPTNAPAAGVPSYRVSPGDVLAVSYFPRPTSTVKEYLIDSQDILTITVAGLETRSGDVTVRPDGCISFYSIGELLVRGLTVAQVRAEVTARMARIMPGAEVTVILREGNALAREFLRTLISTDLGATRIIQVRQDGAVTIPLVGEVHAAGKTMAQLTREIEGQYDRVFRGGIAMTLNLNTSSEGSIAVLGEVRTPGRYAIVNPVSPFFALAMAGGALDTAKNSQIVVVKRQPDGRVGWHVVNLDLNSGAPLGPEIALAPQDMLLVPKTGVANLNLFVDQYIRRMLPLSVGHSAGSWQYTVAPY